jgi:ArsR family transcriptional regulator, arsenate/arsenite/antimonite-responsive transcriptional repressor
MNTAAADPIVVAPERLATLAHALSDPTRLGILRQLQHGERCVCDLTGDLDASQSRLSFHLKVLKEAGLVADRKDGRWSFYRINPDALDAMHDAVVGLRPKPGLPIVAEGCCG